LKERIPSLKKKTSGKRLCVKARGDPERQGRPPIARRIDNKLRRLKVYFLSPLSSSGVGRIDFRFEMKNERLTGQTLRRQ
jgi:hypothetical protein